jgi:hypothetical protein
MELLTGIEPVTSPLPRECSGHLSYKSNTDIIDILTYLKVDNPFYANTQEALLTYLSGFCWFLHKHFLGAPE